MSFILNFNDLERCYKIAMIYGEPNVIFHESGDILCEIKCGIIEGKNSCIVYRF